MVWKNVEQSIGIMERKGTEAMVMAYTPVDILVGI